MGLPSMSLVSLMSLAHEPGARGECQTGHGEDERLRRGHESAKVRFEGVGARFKRVPVAPSFVDSGASVRSGRAFLLSPNELRFLGRSEVFQYARRGDWIEKTVALSGAGGEARFSPKPFTSRSQASRRLEPFFVPPGTGARADGCALRDS